LKFPLLTIDSQSQIFVYALTLNKNQLSTKKKQWFL
jgi:hypothetical protein